MAKLALIGIDGATYDLIRPMVERGELPHIARLLREGASGDLESATPPITPPAWVSMMTGLNPGKHGIYNFMKRSRGSYGLELVDSSLFACSDIFSVLGSRGWSTGAFSVPMTYPPFPVNGYMISGIPMPMEGDGLAWPPETMGQLGKFLGKDYEPDINYAKYDGKNEPESENLDRYDEIRDELFRVEHERIDLMVEWIRRNPTDFWFGVLSITDRCQHYFWKFQDRTHDGWSEEGERRFGKVIRDSYRLSDEALGRFVEVLGADCTIAMASDHGFGPFSSDFYLNRWLEEKGYLAFHKTPRWTVGVATLEYVLHLLKLGVVAGMLPKFLKRIPFVRPKYRRVRDARDIDWSRTRAFACLYGVCLNKVGREPKGIVSPGPEEDALLNEISKALSDLTGPDNDQPIVQRVEVSTDLYSGEYVDMAPDIQFMAMDLSCLPKEDLQAEETFARRRFAAVSGTHRMNGVFAVKGAGVLAGKVFSGMHIQDTMPTLLHALQEEIPAWMEGTVAIDAFQPDWLQQHYPRQSVEPATLLGQAENSWAAEDAAKVEESLKGLGYL